MTRFRLARQTVSEQVVLNAVVRYLERDWRVWQVLRLNNGGVRDRTGRFIRHVHDGRNGLIAGLPDLLALLRGGSCVFLEVKRPGESLSDDQTAFLARCADAGGHGGVVERFEDARRVVGDVWAKTRGNGAQEV